MDYSQFYDGEIIYLKHMRFLDNNEIDYRTNGRPYLVLYVDNKNVYLLKIGSRIPKNVSLHCYYDIKLRNSKKKDRNSYIDLRNIIKVSKKELKRKLDIFQLEDSQSRRRSYKRKFISTKDLNNIYYIIKSSIFLYALKQSAKINAR